MLQIPTIAKCYPPRNFIGAERSSSARFCDQPHFAKTKGRERGSKRRGLLYQGRVEEHLQSKTPEDWVFLSGPWIEYDDLHGKLRYAQPDLLVINPKLGRIVIVEVKLSRVPLAWWQLNRKYRPLVEQIFLKWELAMLEVVSQVYAVAVPEAVTLIHSINQALPWHTSLMHVPYND